MNHNELVGWRQKKEDWAVVLLRKDSDYSRNQVRMEINKTITAEYCDSITEIHAYTSDQSIQDAPHSDLRRARAAAMSMIPTTTGAASAVGLVLHKMKGKLDGSAVRVPTPDGSLTDLTAILSKEVTAEQVNAAMKSASEGALKGILEYTDEPLVSVDIVGNTHSCIFDSSLTSANGTLVKLLGW